MRARTAGNGACRAAYRRAIMSGRAACAGSQATGRTAFAPPRRPLAHQWHATAAASHCHAPAPSTPVRASGHARRTEAPSAALGAAAPCGTPSSRRRLRSSRAAAADGPPSAQGGSPDMAQEPLWTVPTALTVFRLLLLPPILWLGTVACPAAAHAACGVFVVASLTDWLDGYLARRLGVSTMFGAFLDPVADKLMVCTVLVLLCTKTFASGLFADVPSALPALASLVVCRELAMSALRELAASQGPAARGVVAVNWVGKYKTALQLVSLSMLLYAMNGGADDVTHTCALAGPWLLTAATALTVQSFAVYLAALFKFLRAARRRA